MVVDSTIRFNDRMDGPSVSLGSKLSDTKVSFAIFKRDIKRLLLNPVALVVTLGVCVIPSLYAWYNIVANWDPYGNTQGIKIAIANNDRGTQNDMVGELNAGDKVVDQLKENDQLGWTFVDSAADAKEGVESGEYYAAIVIPKNFSDNLVSMLDGNYHQPKLTYYVNEKKSAIAPKVTDTGANTIEEQINSEFVSTVGETVAGIAKDAGIDFKDKTAQVQDSLTSSVSEASGTLSEVRDSINDMNTAIDKTSGAIASADGALAGLQGQTPSLTQAISQGNDLLGEARTTAGKSITSLSKALSEGSVALSKTSASANAAVGKMAGALTSTTTRIDNSLESLQTTIDHNNALIDRLQKLADSVPTGSEEINALIASTIDTLRGQNESLQAVKDNLSAQSSAIANDASAVSGASDAINTAIQTGTTNISQAQTDLGQNALPKASSALDSFSVVSGDLTGIVSGLTPTIANARGTLSQLDATLKQAKTTLSQTDARLATAANDIAALQTSESMGELADLMGVDVDDVADFMASPVELTSKSIYPVKSFGSGIAPFYTNLALWVGGYVLIAIYKLEVDREGIGSFTARQGYFGRWLLLVLLGALQAIIVTVGDLVIGVQCVNPLLFVLGGIAISFTYVNIIYALSTTFKHIGKAIGVILVIVQIPGSSGMYPIEMMPPAFQWLHPLLPFTYGINLLRETVGGMYSYNYLFNLCILGVFLAIALFIGLQLRPLLLNLNLLFDKQLSTTGMMICESNDLPRQRYSLRTAMRVMLDSDSYRRELLEHAVAFEHRYPYYIKGGFAAVVGVQVLIFVLSTVLDVDNNGKIILLVIWIISVIVICGWLINIEYIRASLNTQMRISALSDEDLRREMREHTAAIPAARRMFGLNASERGSKSKDQAVDQSTHHDMHHVPANGDDTFVMNEDGVPLGKHSKGGEA